MSDRILSQEQIQAMERLLVKGERVELTKEKDGRVKMRTVCRKEVKI